MAKYNKMGPQVDDIKLNFHRERLFREVSHMFKWDNIPENIPVDYLERSLVRQGNVLYYEDEDVGQDVMVASIVGYNRHGFATQARTYSPNTVGEKTYVERNIKRLTDSENAKELFNPKTDGVLIQNMEFGQSLNNIVEYYAYRLALVQQSIDTNIMWTNMPYIFQTANKDTKMSIEAMFRDIFSGKPAIIVDKDLLMDNRDRTGVPTGIPFIAKDLYDVMNEINMHFKQVVGFDTAGVDKAERVNTLEIESNNQHTTSVIDIMLQQRKIAVENINAFFGTNIEVNLLGHGEDGEEEEEEFIDETEEVEEDGGENSGIEEPIKD